MEPEPPICAFIMEGHDNTAFVLPQPEHECASPIRAQLATGHYEDVDVFEFAVAVTRYYNGVIPGFFVNFDVRH